MGPELTLNASAQSCIRSRMTVASARPLWMWLQSGLAYRPFISSMSRFIRFFMHAQEIMSEPSDTLIFIIASPPLLFSVLVSVCVFLCSCCFRVLCLCFCSCVSVLCSAVLCLSLFLVLFLLLLLFCAFVFVLSPSVVVSLFSSGCTVLNFLGSL